AFAIVFIRLVHFADTRHAPLISDVCPWPKEASDVSNPLVAVVLPGNSLTAQAQVASSAQESGICEAVNQTINGYLKHIDLASERSCANGTSGKYGETELTNAFRIIRLNVE